MASAMTLPIVSPVVAWAAGANPPSIEELVRSAQATDAALSPNGERIALLSQRPGTGDKKIAYVTLLKASNPDDGPLTVKIGELEIERIVWANDERLLVWINAKMGYSNTQTGNVLADKSEIPVRRILAIGLDGGNQKVLNGSNIIDMNRNFDLTQMIDPLNDDPQHILIQAWDFIHNVVALYKVDVYTGNMTLTERGSSSTRDWVAQGGLPIARSDFNQRGTIMSIYLRAPGEKDWTFYRKVRRDLWNQLDFRVAGPADEPGFLLVASRADDQDTISLRKFDVKTRSFGEVIASRPDRDVTAAAIGRRYIGARYADDRAAYLFRDPKMAAHFKGLNAFFQNECSVVLHDVSADENRYLFYVTGPREAGAFYYYDRVAKRFDNLGHSKPWLTPERLAPVETLKVTTRDGATIGAYLTVPLTPGPHPLVVLPHGGPEVRDTLDFDLFAQVFAAQGWLVLQPNFRGSGGFGKAFADAGRKRWGDRMQEDVEDALAQVVATGRVSPGKVAICGASYGGYAALMGAVRNPDLYRSVVSIAGACDLMETLAFSRSQDGVDSPAYAYWTMTIGDPKTDQAMLEAASPARFADRIKAPVLLIHGAKDTIVDPRQSKIMAAALKRSGKAYDHIELAKVGHRDWKEADLKLILTRSVAHLKAGFA